MAGNLCLSDDSVRRLIEMGHLSSGVGHHVINAFSAIVSNAELLRIVTTTNTVVDPVALAETIIKAAMDASTVARRLIDYTRPVTSIEPGRTAMKPVSVSLETFVAEQFLFEKSRAPEHIQWETDFQAVAPIRGHVPQLACMVSRLLDNAYEAIGNVPGTIALTTCTDQRGWIVLEIRDSGVGMPPHVMDRAVEPFFSTKPGHLGVGLSIAHGIWRRHHGTLAVQSQPGEGTRLRLCVDPSRVGV